MVFRLFNLPLSDTNFNKELDHIRKLARINGFSETTIDTIIRNHQRKRDLRELTTLRSTNNALIRKSFNYFPALTNSMKNVMKKHEVQMVFASRNKLKNLLGGTKDRVNPLDKSGIYMGTCDTCAKKYIGLTKRALKKRIAEHIRYVNNKDIEQTALTDHVVTSVPSHKISRQSFKLLEEVRDIYKLNVTESFHIYKNKLTAVNKDDGNGYSTLFELIKRHA